MQTYRNLEVVSAYQAQEYERIVTRDGVRDVTVGTWVIYGQDGVRLMDDAPFRARFGEWTEPDPEEPEEGDSGTAGRRGSAVVTVYDPMGRSVGEVIDYMRSHPGEVDGVKALESISNTPRKGIMNFSG